MDNEPVTKRPVFIDKSSPVPYYHQLKVFLMNEIESGRLLPMQKIPSETELCERFDISRTVVRQAIKDLQNEGYLTTEKGKGTFVSRPKIVGGLVQSLTGFHEDMVRRGFTVSTEILKQEVQGASQKVSEALGIEGGSPVIVISRVRRLNGEPSVYVTTYIPQKICPELEEEDLQNQSLYALLEGKYGLEIHRGHRYIGVSLANEYEAGLLNIEVGSPLIELDSTSYLKDGRPLEYFHALHRGDRTRFEVELVRIRE
ncbi:MAG: GntR family transcriptional regulator [Spirochaetes bacterium]|nr:GntR family transcriptional regulator [Spirochaetota bacterium]